MRTILLNFIICYVLITISSQVSAQSNSDDCSSSIKRANDLYELGDFSKCIETLKPCISSLSGTARYEAYRLMALSYLDLNDSAGTHENIVNLLKHNPHYREFPLFDPVKFTQVLGRYDVWAKMELGAMWGINLSSINALKNYSLTNSAATYYPGTGFDIGLTFEYFLKKNLALQTEAMFSRINYSRIAEDVVGWNQEYQERMNYFDVPLRARYYFYQVRKLEVGVDLGAQVSFLDKTNSNIIFTKNGSNELAQNTYQADAQRNRTILYGLAGITAKYQLGGGKFGLNIRYSHGLVNVNDPDKRFDDLNFAYNNLYVDSDFRLNILAAAISYSFPIRNMYSVQRKK